ncbi:TetR/AcrR family transcriptional regulator [Actinokineospora inagensis]|uniref:TetR/AcrR family transcriptional regulator n=1 Tax=Actinokineospora inagensis TaxID=103730 RepID=UPI000415A265|nr:TetR/AcrR family transcriptional regulator [Actinokineospora inagensis]
MADKRRAVLDGALATFARDGYTRAGMDAISAAAGVSTRTIYNHFTDKAALFEAVIQHSAAQVAAEQVAVIDRHLTKVTDLEADLVEFAHALAGTADRFADHFALVRQINADLGHIPAAAVAAWQETGPLRVHRALADRLGALAERGLLDIGDPRRAAVHFMLLVSVDNPSTRTPLDADHDALVRAGVRAFLYGYQRT